jgi:hypothetical protein
MLPGADLPEVKLANLFQLSLWLKMRGTISLLLVIPYGFFVKLIT